MKPDPLDAWRQHLLDSGLAPGTVKQYCSMVRRFLKHADAPPERISEAQAAAFFAGMDRRKRFQYSQVITPFLKFAMSRLPVPVNARGGKSPRAPGKKEIALRQKWDADKAREQKLTNDKLIAKLARRVIDHYLFFQRLLKDDDVDLDTVARFADECRELIESNLPLFMSMSAEGHNIHTKIDERVR